MSDQISVVMRHPEGATVVLASGQQLRITEEDVEALQMAFPGECEACGFDPDNPYDEEN